MNILVVKFYEVISMSLFSRISNALREINSPHWSLTKLGIFFCMYPAITFVFVFDAWMKSSMDWMNTCIFIVGVTAPRAISQFLAARFGYVSKEGEKLEDDNKMDGRDLFHHEEKK